MAAVTAALGGIMILSAGGSSAAPVTQAVNGTQTTVTWQGNGSDQIPVCDEGQAGAYHWILTPGGGATLSDGTLTVQYAGGGSTVTSGEFHNDGGNGAMHFYVTVNPNDTPTSASVTFTYSGGNGNFVLTISDAACTEGSTPPETTPVETTPVETTPVETTPVETTPASSNPASESTSSSFGISGGSTTHGTTAAVSSSSAPIPAGVSAGLTKPVENAGLKAWGTALLLVGGAGGLLAGLWPTRRRAH